MPVVPALTMWRVGGSEVQSLFNMCIVGGQPGLREILSQKEILVHLYTSNTTQHTSHTYKQTKLEHWFQRSVGVPLIPIILRGHLWLSS